MKYRVLLIALVMFAVRGVIPCDGPGAGADAGVGARAVDAHGARRGAEPIRSLPR